MLTAYRLSVRIHDHPPKPPQRRDAEMIHMALIAIKPGTSVYTETYHHDDLKETMRFAVERAQYFQAMGYRVVLKRGFRPVTR